MLKVCLPLSRLHSRCWSYSGIRVCRSNVQSLSTAPWRPTPSEGALQRSRCLELSAYSRRLLHADTSFIRWRATCGGAAGRGAPAARYSTGRSGRWKQEEANQGMLLYTMALAVFVLGLSYAAVPLYRIFCQATGYGGTVGKIIPGEKIEKMVPVEERELTIRFNADTSRAMRWKFQPHQQEIKLVPGETALAFYKAINPTDEPITGVATYNVIPFDAGQYFNKVQCFCFEEQRLNPQEEVDMPVFFYVDPEFAEDPSLAKVNSIMLSYTFFESKEGVDLPVPNFLKN